MVDEVCSQVISPGPMCSQPILTQYCDGQTGQLPQLALPVGVSKYLGDQRLYSLLRFSAIITGMICISTTAEEISGMPDFLARVRLWIIGSRGPEGTEQLQEQLNRHRPTIIPADPEASPGRRHLRRGNTAESCARSSRISSVFPRPARWITGPGIRSRRSMWA